MELGVPRPGEQVKDCQFGVSPVNYSDSDLTHFHSFFLSIDIVRSGET